MLVQAYPSKEIDVETFIKESDSFNVKAITGVTVNRNNCVGYCGNKIHPGYVTEKIEKEHNCCGKQCVFFYKFFEIGKKATNPQRELEKKNKLDISNYIESINTLGIDGFKVLSLEHKHTNCYDAIFVSVGSIDEKEIAQIVSKKVGIDVKLIRKEISFDNIEKLFGK